MGQAASPSLYDFAGGDPVNFFDPDGRFGGTPLSAGEYFSAVGSGLNEGLMVISDTLNPTQLVGRKYAGLYADSGGYNPNAPEARLSRDVVIGTVSAVATAPIAAVGGGIIAGGLATGELSTTGAIVLGVGSGGTLSALSNVATQLVQNNGNINIPINVTQEVRAFVVSGVLGGVSGAFASVVNSANQNSAAIVLQLEAQSNINEAILIADGYSPALAQSVVTFSYAPIISEIQSGTNILDIADSTADNIVFPVIDFAINESLDMSFSTGNLGYVPGSSGCPPPFQTNWSLLSQ
jgi:hypothetical protein